jgi:hypothetical protein
MRTEERFDARKGVGDQNVMGAGVQEEGVVVV